jgi:SAM-dependent methyltransferase
MNTKEARHNLVGPGLRWETARQFQKDFILKQGLKPTNLFLDIGCGTLRGDIPIICYLDEGNFFGIDVRDSVIEEAKLEAIEESVIEKKPNLIAFKEFSELNLPEMDFIWAFCVLIHLSDKILEDCFAFVSKILKQGGVFYGNVNSYSEEKQAATWHQFPIQFKRVEVYKELGEKYGLKMEIVGELPDLGYIPDGPTEVKLVMLKFTKT